MIVEDEILLAWLAREALGQAGYEVVAAAEGRSAAVATALSERPDLVLMDIDLACDPRQLDDWDGVGAACEIYAKAGIRCLLTGHLDARRRRQAATARPLGMLAKPYKASELVAHVGVALARQRRRDSLSAATP